MGEEIVGARRALPPSRRAPVSGSRWAVVVGVSTYQDERLNLRYAANDAQQLAELIRTPNGGGFPEDHVLLLVDEQATSSEVTRALRGFLMRPAREDLVLIYFACHGGPDPRRPGGPLYLLTYDTELADIASTAVPMDEIQGALRNALLAERVVVIADTCHSGNLGAAGIRAPSNTAEATNSYLNRLAEAKAGVALLTSCEAAESSQEGDRWGYGHGVFTWHLLEGMRGAADGFGTERDGIVAVGELFEYVRAHVRADTHEGQHPSVGAAMFDRDLPMAVAGDLDVRRHLELAGHLVELGWLTDDPAAFACAVRETEVADELAGLTGALLPSAALLRAEALLATGRHADAAAALGEGPGGDEPLGTDLVRGVALASIGQAGPAIKALSRFAVAHPEHAEATWAADYAATMGRTPLGGKHALLIGAGTFQSAQIPELPGARHDPLAVADHLTHRLGFPSGNVVTLTDERATRAEILSELDSLAQRALAADVVVVSCSGHVTVAPDEVPDSYFITYDTRLEHGALEGGISGREFAEHLSRIPGGGTRLLILDPGLGPGVDELVRTHPEWAAIGTARGSLDVNIGGEYFGALTKALLDSWPDGESVTCGDLVELARRWLRQHDYDVKPVIVGDPTAPLVGRWFNAARLWWLARDRSGNEVRASEVAAATRPAVYGHAAWALGRNYLRGRAPFAALRSFDEARQSVGTQTPLLEVDRIRAQLAAGLHAEAATAVAECARVPGASPDIMGRAAAAVADLVGRRPRALVVGIDSYSKGSRPRGTVIRPSGARADAESFATTLTRMGVVSAEDVVVLLDEKATRARIVAEFKVLADHAATDLAVFHFAGVGSCTPDGYATILSADARTHDGSELVPDVTLRELAALSADSPNLIAIIDAGGPAQAVPAPGERAAGPMAQFRTSSPAEKGLDVPIQGAAGEDAVLGAVTLRSTVPKGTKDRAVERPVPRSGQVRGRLTFGIEQALERARSAGRTREPMTYADLIGGSRLKGRATLAGVAKGEPILRHRTALAAADAALRELELRPVRACLSMATALIEDADSRDESLPRAHLEAGLALEALGDHVRALTHLRAARNLSDESSGSAARDSIRDPEAPQWYRWANHHLGRILYEHGGDLNEAVAALRAAYDCDPDEPRTCFHLALAIQTLVQRESLREVEAHLQRYLDLGAPLGQMGRVREILASIDNA